MAISCVKTALGSFYRITDSEITHLLGNYAGHGEYELMEAAEEEMTIRAVTMITIFVIC